MVLDVVRSKPWKLAILAGLAMAFALALSDNTEAASFNEVKKLLASDASLIDRFGRSVDVSGDTAIVGAYLEDAGGSGAGAVYVFQRNQGGADNWGEVQKLLASDAEISDNFGISVAVSGDTAVVGAYREDAGGSDAGAAYVFQRDRGGAGNWGEVTKLTASSSAAFDNFGFSVAISDGTIVVGAWSEDTAGTDAGAAYVFQRDQGGADNWGEVTKLTVSDAEASDFFGFSVAVSGDTAVVGAHGENARGSDAGSAYVFQRDRGGADNWGEVKKLLASDAQISDNFGISVAVNGDTAVVGARLQDVGSLDRDFDAGAAYVFQRNQGGADNWGEVTKLTASDAQIGDWFGITAAVSGDTAVVGASRKDAGGAWTGAAYTFQRNEGGADNWGEVAKLTASDAEAGDQFGITAAVSGDTAVVGAVLEDAGGHDAGAAYVFDLLGVKSTPTSTPTVTPAPTATDTPVPRSTPAATATPDVSTGDADCDDTVNSIDASLVLQFSAGLLGSLPCADGGDVNGDGEVTSIDAALILQFTAGLLDSLPPPS